MKKSATLRECGCGLRGSGTLVGEREGVKIWEVQSDQSPTAHVSSVWWCYSCGRMEWECLDTGKGRHC